MESVDQKNSSHHSKQQTKTPGQLNLQTPTAAQLNTISPNSTDKHREKILLSGIERLLNRKVEASQAKTIKQISCKSETVNMLNRIGLPLAKKLKREKFLQIRKELKQSIENETKTLLEFSKPEKATTLLQSFLDEEEEQLQKAREKIYKRMAFNTPDSSRYYLTQHKSSLDHNNNSRFSNLVQHRGISQIIKDYSHNAELLRIKFKEYKYDNKNRSASNNRTKLLDKNYMSSRQASTAQTSARRHTTNTTPLKGIKDKKQVQIEQNQNVLTVPEQITIFNESAQKMQEKNSFYSNIIRISSAQDQALVQNQLQLKEIEEVEDQGEISPKKKMLQNLTPLAISQNKLQDFQGSPRTAHNNSRKDKLSQNDSVSGRRKNTTNTNSELKKTASFESEDNTSVFTDKTKHSRKGVRFQEKEESKLSPHNVSNQGLKDINKQSHTNQNHQQTQFKDILQMLRIIPPNRHLYFNNKESSYMKQRSIKVKRSASIRTFEHPLYDEIFGIVDMYQRILDCMNETKSALQRRPQNMHHIHLETKKQQIFSIWQQAISITKETDDFSLVFQALKFQGEIYLEFKDFMEAIKHFRQLKNFCDERTRYREKIYTFEQIGIIYRLIEDHKNAIKFFRKQLELAWEQNDEKAEISACDQLSLEYYYIGDLEKSHHFNDRTMRGKLESSESVIKRVSKNLILSKRKRPKYEFYLDPDQLQAYLMKKQGLDQNQPRDSSDFGLSKAYKLLPHFCTKEDEDQHSNEGESSMVNTNEFFNNKNIGPRFISPELAHLNTPPSYEYLQVTDPLLKKKKHAPRLNFGSSLKKHNEQLKKISLRDYIGAEMFKYDLPVKQSKSSHSNRLKLDGHQIFHNIIERVKQSMDKQISSSGQKRSSSGSYAIINHQSLLRMMPKDQIQYGCTVEALERSLEIFKQIMKKQMLHLVRNKWKLGLEFEEICYNV